MATESGWDEIGDETGGPGGLGDEIGDKTGATAGDERDGDDRWSNVYGRRGVRICSAGCWRPRACHATNHKNFIYQPIFTIFAAKNSAISRL